MTLARRLLNSLLEWSGHRVKTIEDYKGLPLKVCVNPSSVAQILINLRLPEDFLTNDKYIKSRDPYGHFGNLRLIADLDTGDIYVWDAGKQTHDDAAMHLGLNYDECARGMAGNGYANLRVYYDFPDDQRDKLDTYQECQERVRALFGYLMY